MSEKQPKLKFEEEKERTATRSPPKKSKVEQSVPKKRKLKQDADKAAEKAQHLRFGKAEITPDEASRMTKQQKRAMYAAAAARSAAHREIDQYEDDNVGTQALNEGNSEICSGFIVVGILRHEFRRCVFLQLSDRHHLQNGIKIAATIFGATVVYEEQSLSAHAPLLFFQL